VLEALTPMRRGFVVLVLLAMMVGLRALKTDAAGNVDPLTLAAIGFVVLAAFAVAELGGRLGLPKVTGYIVTGVVCGPFVFNVLSNTVVGEMKMFTNLALGLIAVTAGLELDLKGLRSLAKTLTSTIGIKLVTGLLLVGGVFVLGEVFFSVLDLGDTGSIIALALVFAAISVGTSPSISLAILSESKAKGRLSELVLGAAVVKDVLVVVLLAVMVAIAKGMLPAEAVEAAGHAAGHGTESHGMGSILLHVGEELGRTILAGALLGGILIAYLRYVRAEMLVFVTAMVLVVVEISSYLHLELLLVFIVAGLIVRNFSDHAHDLLHPLETVSLPVFIVFFANAGASVNLEATLAVLPLALAMSIARAGGFVVAGRLGGRLGGEPEPVRRFAWLGYLPQAGVTLGLVGVAATQLPQVSEEIRTVGMALVALNLLVGPVTLRFALRSAGEITGGEASQAELSDDDASTPATAHPETEQLEARPWERLAAESLRKLAATVAADDQAAIDDYTDRVLTPWVDRVSSQLSLAALRRAQNRREVLLAVRDAIESVRPDTGAAWIEATVSVHADRCEALEVLPGEVTVPLEPEFRSPANDDSFLDATRKRLARLGDAFVLRFRNRTRNVPVRMVARTLVEPAFARALEEAARSSQRLEARMLEELHRCTLGTLDADGTIRAIEAHIEGFVTEIRADLDVAARRNLAELVGEFERIGSPVYPASNVRYSRVEPDLRRWRDRMREDAGGWGPRRDAAARLVLVTNELSMVEQHLDTHVRKQSLDVATEAFDQIREEVEAERRRLQQVVEHLGTLEKLDEASMSRIEMEVAAILPRPVQKKLRTASAKVRRATSAGFASGLVREANIRQSGRETLIQNLGAVIEAERPARVPLVSFDVGENLQAFLSAILVPKLDELLGETWTTYGAAVESMRTCLAAAEFAVSSATMESTENAPATAPAQLAEQLEQIEESLVQASNTTLEAWQALHERIMVELSNMDEQFGEFMVLSTGRGASGAAAAATPWALRWIVWLREKVGDPLRAFVRKWRARIRGEAEHGFGRQYRLRSGAERADAADVRGLLERIAVPKEGLPPMYRALFSSEPIRDPRLFVANRHELSEVVRAERAWMQDANSGNGVLVVGPSGSGKSSLLQVARLKLSTRNVVVVPPRDGEPDDGGLFGTIAREVGGSSEFSALLDTLERRRGAIVIDDLQAWLSLGSRGMYELDEFLSLVVQTRSSTLWVVSLPSELLEAAERLVPVRPAFDRVVELGPVGAADFDRVVESRQSLSGFELSFPNDLRARWLGRLLRKTPRDAYMESLVGLTHGTIRRSLNAWLRRARLDEDEGQVVLESLRVEWGLPLRGQLTATQLALLTLMLRAGGRRLDELAAALALPGGHVARDLHFLRAAGLVQPKDGRHSITHHLRDEIAAALSEFGAVTGGAP